jgi:putative transposase
MPNYRRAFVPGGCWFFTVNLLDRRRWEAGVERA